MGLETNGRDGANEAAVRATSDGDIVSCYFQIQLRQYIISITQLVGVWVSDKLLKSRVSEMGVRSS